MAERRMFSMKIIDSDEFVSMPLSTQALYFHLSMRADDEGFINKHKNIMRMIGSNEDELKLLVAKRFLLTFESGIIVIKHWKIHNYIRKDRMSETAHLKEKNRLFENASGAYSVGDANQVTDTCQPSGNIGKERLGEVSIGEDSYIVETSKKIISYLNKRANKSYKHSTAKTKTTIKARLNEGFTYDDFVAVIEKKVFEWQNDSKMSAYIRPETLFGTKFEGYLQQDQITPKNKVEVGSLAWELAQINKQKNFIDAEVE